MRIKILIVLILIINISSVKADKDYRDDNYNKDKTNAFFKFEGDAETTDQDNIPSNIKEIENRIRKFTPPNMKYSATQGANSMVITHPVTVSDKEPQKPITNTDNKDNKDNLPSGTLVDVKDKNREILTLSSTTNPSPKLQIRGGMLMNLGLAEASNIEIPEMNFSLSVLPPFKGVILPAIPDNVKKITVNYEKADFLNGTRLKGSLTVPVKREPREKPSIDESHEPSFNKPISIEKVPTSRIRGVNIAYEDGILSVDVTMDNYESVAMVELMSQIPVIQTERGGSKIIAYKPIEFEWLGQGMKWGSHTTFQIRPKSMDAPYVDVMFRIWTDRDRILVPYRIELAELTGVKKGEGKPEDVIVGDDIKNFAKIIEYFKKERGREKVLFGGIHGSIELWKSREDLKSILISKP